jgi:hypothetical protein
MQGLNGNHMIMVAPACAVALAWMTASVPAQFETSPPVYR